jgi:hypothetical protein
MSMLCNVIHDSISMLISTSLITNKSMHVAMLYFNVRKLLQVTHVGGVKKRPQRIFGRQKLYFVHPSCGLVFRSTPLRQLKRQTGGKTLW